MVMLLSFGAHHMSARVDHTIGLVVEIDAYGIEGGPIYLNAMVGFYLNERE